MDNGKDDRRGLSFGARLKGTVVMFGGVALHFIGRVADSYNLGAIVLMLYLLSFALFMGGLAFVIGGDAPTLSAGGCGIWPKRAFEE